MFPLYHDQAFTYDTLSEIRPGRAAMALASLVAITGRGAMALVVQARGGMAALTSRAARPVSAVWSR